MTKYQQYKESEVEWIKDVPIDWSIIKIKYVAKVESGSTPKSDESYWSGDIYWITPSDIGPIKNDKYLSETARKISQAGVDSSACSLCPPYSVVITNRGPIGNTIIPTMAFTTNQGCKTLIPNNIHYEYLFYILKTSSVVLESLGQGTTFLELSSTSLRNFSIPLPSLKEQRQIVSFLDQKTSIIDDLIQKKLRKIELLKEHRISIINHAVTKGLNRHTRLKDSGVEWIGEIPSGWNISKLKYLTSNIGDGIHSTPNYVESSDKYFINGNNLINGSIEIFESTKCVDEEEFLKYQLELSRKTLLLSINGTIGNLAYFLGEHVILGKSVCYINCLSMIDTHFLFYLLKSSHISDYFTFELTGTTINNLSLNTVRNTPIPLPQIPLSLIHI